MNIAKYYPEKMRNDKHFQLNTEIRDLIIEEGAEKLKIKKQFDEEFMPAYNNVDEALKKITKSALTEDLQKADATRDDIFLGMCDVIKGYVRHFDPSVKDAARRIKIITDTYGNIAKKPLNEQTSATYNLLQDLRKTPDLLKAIKIDDWVEALEKSNKEFDGIVKARNKENAMKTEIVLRDARKALDTAVRDIFKTVEVFAKAFGVADYVNFMKRVNVVIVKAGGKSVKLGADFRSEGETPNDSEED